MIKRFIKDTGIYGISGILSKGVSIFLVPFYTRVLSPADYGIIDMIAIVAAIISVTVPLEITQAVARFLADSKEEENKITVSSTALFLTLGSFLVFLFVAELFAPLWASLILENRGQVNIFRVASLSIFLTGLFYFVQNQLRWLLRPAKAVAVSILYTVLTLLLTIFFVLILGTGVIGIFWAYCISAFCSFILGFYFTRDCYRLYFSKKKLNEMLKFSLPLVPSSVGVFFINYAQRIIIRSLMTLADLGLYGVGARLSSIVNIAFQSIKTALVPLIYQHHNEKDTPNQLSKLYDWLSFVLLISFVAISVFSKEILILLTTPAYYSSYIIVPFLFVNQMFDGMSVFASGMAIVRKTNIIANINILGAIFSILISFGMIYYWGIIGAAIAVAIKSIFTFSIQMHFSQKYYKVPYNFSKTIFAFLSAVLIILIAMNTEKLVPVNFILFKSLLIIIYVLFLLTIIQIITYKEIIDRIKVLINKN